MTDAITAERAAREPILSAGASYDGADAGAIAAARAFAGDFLAAPGARPAPVSRDHVDLAKLVVSELVTNAVRHAPGPFRLVLELGRDHLDISVIDGVAAAPVPRGHDPRRIGQHGVEIVIAVCESVTVEPHPAGKQVRARLALAPADAGQGTAGPGEGRAEPA
ncbi:ATP-binding protein [Streptomyces sp. NPDC051180]|uniref:ATP-binding protein n=1 Tax=unclassified Streptomyces TaxID=2593676 RepID=UPI00344F8D77